jgi:hypothetical protein
MERKLSRVEKLVKGAFEIGKYGTYVGIMSSIGCSHLPNFISTSEDGRYVATAVNHEGKLDFDPSQGNSAHYVIIDTHTLDVRMYGESFDVNDFASISNTSEKLAFMTENPYDNSSVDINIFSRGENVTIKGGGFPVLTSDGKYVVYSKIVGKGKSDMPDLDITIRDLATKRERSLGIEGLVSDLSPDNKHLTFLTFEDKGPKEEFFLGVCDIFGRNRKSIGKLEMDGLEYPTFINNRQFLYLTGKKSKEDDSEIHIGEIDGRSFQVTNNDYEELFPQVGKGGSIYYMALKDGGKPGPNAIFRIDTSSKSWKTFDTGVRSSSYFRVAGDNLVFFGENDELYMKNLKNNSVPLNLSDVIKTKFPDMMPLFVPEDKEERRNVAPPGTGDYGDEDPYSQNDEDNIELSPVIEPEEENLTPEIITDSKK